MIPILYDKTETSFTSNGLGRLIDCVSCEVTEERNGIYECEFVYPISGKLYKQLMAGGIIGVIHDDNHDVQPFDIYKSTAPIDGMVTFNAHHISYRLSTIVLSPYTASDISSAMSGISSHSVNTNPFSFSTTKSTVANFALTRPKSVRATLMGEEGSFLDVFGGGEYKFDKWSVTLSQHRGTDTGVTVRYGKNLTDIEATVDSSGLFSAVAPYYQSEEVTVYLPEYYVTPTTPVSPVVIRTMDMTDYFEETPTEAQLRSAAIAFLDANTPWIPSENIKIDFTPMWQSPEYESVAEIQRVGLCDTVSIYYTDMDIVAEKAKVVRVVYDVLREKFSEIEVGDINREYVVTQEEGQHTTTASALAAYPIGSIYMSLQPTNPGTLFGGTWEQIQDTFLLAAGSTWAAGATGGEATHTLTVAEMPSHNHMFLDSPRSFSERDITQSDIICVNDWESSNSVDYGTSWTGGSGAHNNMPPYLAVYMWKRTA